MEVNEQVVSQGIVLAGIIAGFAFVIAAEIALREPLSEELQGPALSFLVTGLFGIVTAAEGVIYFGKASDPTGQAELGGLFLRATALTGLAFLFSILYLFRRRFVGEPRRSFTVIMVAIVAFVALLIWSAYS